MLSEVAGSVVVFGAVLFATSSRFRLRACSAKTLCETELITACWEFVSWESTLLAKDLEVLLRDQDLVSEGAFTVLECLYFYLYHSLLGTAHLRLTLC